MSNTKSWLGKRHLTPAARDEVVREVAEQTGVHPRDILSQSRVAKIAHARQFCMWKLRQTGLYSYPTIGRAFGRDHTSVIHAERAHAARMCGEGAE